MVLWVPMVVLCHVLKFYVPIFTPVLSHDPLGQPMGVAGESAPTTSGTWKPIGDVAASGLPSVFCALLTIPCSCHWLTWEIV